MFQNFRRFLPVVVLAACSFAGSPAALAQSTPPTTAPLFNDPPPVDQGWQGLAKLLDALTPGVDTSIPLTPSQITDRIAAMINEGRTAEALDVIEKRQAQRAAGGEPGHDVQLLFLKARAYAETGNTEAAQASYLELTTQYPELPEPWNNLASLYLAQGNLDRAFDALAMSLRADPSYVQAKANMAKVHTLKAYDLYRQAEQAGLRSAGLQANALKAVFENQPAPVNR
ncbi:MAG: tetratricopeptide repeat protein [Pusillimonas sp.]